jgi:origin recognition complex subunit 2
MLTVFDLSLLSRYNFLWQDVTTFLSYIEETAYENSLLVQQSGGLALASLHNVFQSLTSNAKEIYMLLVERQLESEDPKYLGMYIKL